MKEALTKKLGPLPRWAWGAILLVAILLYLRHRSKQQSQDAAQNATDPYSSYNTGSYVDSGQPYGDMASGGTYPLGGGLGSGFDPTSFQEGLTYGQGFGTSNNSGPASDGSVPTGDGTGSGNAVPPAQGDTNITVNTPDGSGSTGPGGGRGHGRKKKATGNHPGSSTKGKGHTGTNRHTSTGGGQHNRHPGQHTKPPKQGTHNGANANKYKGGGSQHPNRTHAKTGGAPITNAPHTTRDVPRVTAPAHPRSHPGTQAPHPAAAPPRPTAAAPPRQPPPRRGRR